MVNEVWENRRVLVTGNTGFKGSWLCERLLGAGARVSGYALAPQEPALYGLLDLDARVASTYADVRDLERLAAALAEQAPDVVFHLAAQPIVLASVADPVGTFATNVQGTVHLLEAVRRTPSVRAVVVVTSDKVYANDGSLWPLRENDPLGGSDPYSASKSCAELVVASYRKTYFADGPWVATARAGNVIGGGDWSSFRIVPDLVRDLAAGRTPLLRAPHAVRPWQHVLDAIDGYVVLAEALLERGAAVAEGWNFAPSDDASRTVADLTEQFLRAYKAPGAFDTTGPDAARHDAPTLRLDASRARALLAWRSRLDFEAAVRWTADWYRVARDGHAAARAATREQLDAYAGLFAPA